MVLAHVQNGKCSIISKIDAVDNTTAVHERTSQVDLLGRCLHTDVPRSVFPGEMASRLPRRTGWSEGGWAAIHLIKGLAEVNDVGLCGDAKPLGGSESLRQLRHSAPVSIPRQPVTV